MLKNMIIYRIAEGWQQELQAVEEALAKRPFAECGPTQERSVGWVPPRGEAHGALVESVAGQWVMRLMTEAKQIPASVLARKVQEKCDAIEQAEGRKPGKKEKKELKDEAKLDLLPLAFTKQGAMLVWIDTEKRTLALDTGSQARADEVVSLLVESLPGFALALLDTQTSPQAAMAHWLLTQEAPSGFSIDRECELKAADESKAVVKYGRHPLDIAEVKQHIEHGKLPTKLALTWDDRVSFVLTEGLQLRKLDLLDAVIEGHDKDGGFDADVAIATGELSRLIPDLIEALGGEGRTGLGQDLPASLDGVLPAFDPSKQWGRYYLLSMAEDMDAAKVKLTQHMEALIPVAYRDRISWIETPATEGFDGSIAWKYTPLRTQQATTGPTAAPEDTAPEESPF